MSELERIQKEKQAQSRRVERTIDKKELDIDFMNVSLDELREDYRRQRKYSPLLGNPFLELPHWMNLYLSGGVNMQPLYYQTASVSNDTNVFKAVELPVYDHPFSKSSKKSSKELGKKFDKAVGDFLKKLFHMIMKMFFKMKKPVALNTEEESLDSLHLNSNNYYRFLINRRKRRKRRR